MAAGAGLPRAQPKQSPGLWHRALWRPIQARRAKYAPAAPASPPDPYDACMADRELAGIAGRLYSLPFNDFVSARATAAKEAAGGATAGQEQRSLAAQVRALPKPSVGAWAVNMLVTARPDILRQLAQLGESMRVAQSALDVAELRRLGQERRQLLNIAVETARAVAQQRGRKISDAVAAEVEQTLRAATADEGAAAAVQSGRLLRTLSADGVDAVDVSGAVAVPAAAASGAAGAGGPGAGGRQLTGQPRLQAVRQEPRRLAPSARERAEARLREAEEDARLAAAEADRYKEELAEASAAAARLAQEAQTLQKQLELTEAELKAARKQGEEATAKAQQAARTAERERRKEDLARERVLRLGNTPE